MGVLPAAASARLDDPHRSVHVRPALRRQVARRAARRRIGTSAMAEPTLLSGGNPQIAKGHGDAPVQAYIAAMPGWKSGVWRRLDALIEKVVPGVAKAVRWN